MTPSSDQSDSTLTLANEFPPASREQWRELVASVLRKAGRLPDGYTGPVEDLIATTLGEGVTVAPLYTADSTTDGAAHRVGVPGLAPFVRNARPLGAIPNGWDIRARHADPDVAATAEAV